MQYIFALVYEDLCVAIYGRQNTWGHHAHRAVQLLKDRLAAIQTSVTVDVVKQLRELNYDAKSTERKKEMVGHRNSFIQVLLQRMW